MDTRTVVTRNPEAAFRRLQVGQGAVVLLLDSGQYHGLNEIGTAIWNLIDGTRDVAAITRDLQHQLDDPPAGLEAVVEEFVAELRARQLVEG